MNGGSRTEKKKLRNKRRENKGEVEKRKNSKETEENMNGKRLKKTMKVYLASFSPLNIYKGCGSWPHLAKS